MFEGLIHGQCVGRVSIIVIKCGRGNDDGHVFCVVAVGWMEEDLCRQNAGNRFRPKKKKDKGQTSAVPHQCQCTWLFHYYDDVFMFCYSMDKWMDVDLVAIVCAKMDEFIS